MQNQSRPLRSRGEKFTSNLSHYAPTHRNFHAKFFQNFCQLLSEQRHLCVNNPREVERERSQTGLPGQQPPPRATCPDPRRPGPVETVQPSRRLSALPDPSPRWPRTVGPAQPCGVSTDVPHGSQRPPPNRAPTAGVWRQGARPFRNLPTPEPRSGLCVVSPGDPAKPGSLACRWRTAKAAASRLGPSAQPPPGPLYVTSDRDAPAARPGPSRHRPARGLLFNGVPLHACRGKCPQGKG
jgi:hypothetical protein